MENLFDDLSKSLAESVSRRDTLRRLGAVFAGAVLTPLGLGTAWAGSTDRCKAFCKCRTTTQQSQCLAACRACNGNTSRLCGSCGSYTCCSTACCNGACSDLLHDPNCGACRHDCGAMGETCCGNYCADLADDVFNCGRCGTVCAAPPPGEVVGCVAGTCVYDCAPGAIDCNGTCTFLDSDPDNCGACGNVCDICINGTCTNCNQYPYIYVCNGTCVDLSSDDLHCGACGVNCAALGYDYCDNGQCKSYCSFPCDGGW